MEKIILFILAFSFMFSSKIFAYTEPDYFYDEYLYNNNQTYEELYAEYSSLYDEAVNYDERETEAVSEVKREYDLKIEKLSKEIDELKDINAELSSSQETPYKLFEAFIIFIAFILLINFISTIFLKIREKFRNRKETK